MSFRPGENVGPYRIIEQLGQGGMATVYKAYHANLDRYVAIKVLHPVFKQDANFEARFQREAKVIAQLEHPNIVPVYDYNEQDGNPYLVMRFIEGKTLKARLSEGPLEPLEAVEIIGKVGNALAYAHESGYLHRDVKPSNIILTDDGKVFLADFGLARIAQSGESTLSHDMMLGTPSYMSPEQARGEEQLDAGTDIYSLGVVLYEVTVGQVPFSADTPYAVIHDHIFTPLPLPSAVNPNVPESVERVLLKALAKSRDDRFATVGDLTDAFVQGVEAAGMDALVSMTETFQAAPRVRVPDATPTSPELSTVLLDEEDAPRRRRRWPLWVAGAAVLAVLCLGAVIVVGSSMENAGASDTPAEGETDTGEVPPDDLVFDEPPPNGECAEHGVHPLSVEEAIVFVEDFPDNACAHLALALAQIEAGALPEGFGELGVATDLGLSGETLLVMGHELGGQGYHAEAARLFAEAYADHGFPEAEAFAFWSLLEAKGTPQGRAAIDDLNGIYPDLAFPKSALAFEVAEEGNIREADEFATEAIAIQPESPVAHYAMGFLFMNTERPVDARVQFACVLRSLETPDVLRIETQHHIEEVGPIRPSDLSLFDGEPPVELLGCAPDRLR